MFMVNKDYHIRVDARELLQDNDDQHLSTNHYLHDYYSSYWETSLW